MISNSFLLSFFIIYTIYFGLSLLADSFRLFMRVHRYKNSQRYVLRDWHSEDQPMWLYPVVCHRGAGAGLLALPLALKDGCCFLLIIRLTKCAREGEWAVWMFGWGWLVVEITTPPCRSICSVSPGTLGASLDLSLLSAVKNEAFLNPRHLLCFPLGASDTLS